MKFLPNLLNDLQGFANEEITKSKILDVLCTVRSFENINKDLVDEWLQSVACKLGLQHMTNTYSDGVAANLQNKRKEKKKKVRRMGVKEETEVVRPSVMSWHYIDITSARKIFTAVRRSLNYPQKKQPLYTVSETKHQLCKRK
jgi:hypothetical protein